MSDQKIDPNLSLNELLDMATNHLDEEGYDHGDR